MVEERQTIGDGGYELAVRGEARRWSWVLIRPGGVAAQGVEQDRISAWRTGAFTAEAISALERIGRRSF